MTAGLPAATVRAAAAAAAVLAERLPYEVAAAWLHADALAQHAVATGTRP